MHIQIELALRDGYSFATTAGNLTLGNHLENLDASDTQSLLINLLGNNLANELTGNDGNNLIAGGLGNDVLTGGAGSDIFRVDTKLNELNNIDVITDFLSGIDKIQLENAIFKNLTYTGSLKEVNFFKGADFVPQGATNYILYDESNGGVYYDVDGTGVNSATQFLTLLGVPNLSASDFIVE